MQISLRKQSSEIGFSHVNNKPIQNNDERWCVFIEQIQLTIQTILSLTRDDLLGFEYIIIIFLLILFVLRKTHSHL